MSIPTKNFFILQLQIRFHPCFWPTYVDFLNPHIFGLKIAKPFVGKYLALGIGSFSVAPAMGSNQSHIFLSIAYFFIQYHFFAEFRCFERVLWHLQEKKLQYCRHFTQFQFSAGYEGSTMGAWERRMRYFSSKTDFHSVFIVGLSISSRQNIS